MLWTHQKKKGSRAECRVYGSCGTQRDLEDRLLAEQSNQARAAIEAIRGHMRNNKGRKKHT
eukprot:12938466-Prorocentrum_lima.AAC.1